MNIVHVTTEFDRARAGGLGAVVDGLVQNKLPRDSITVVLPYFTLIGGEVAYDFLKRRSEAITFQAKIYGSEVKCTAYKYHYADNVEVLAINPGAPYEYLTEIESASNPYVMSLSGIFVGLKRWASQDRTIEENLPHIYEKLEEFKRIQLALEELRDRINYLNQEYKRSNSSDNISYRELLRVRLEEAKVKSHELVKEKKVLLTSPILITSMPVIDEYDLEGIMFKIAIERLALAEEINGDILFDLVTQADRTENPIDVIHIHHFGQAFRKLKKALSSSSCVLRNQRPAFIKTLHSLNEELFHLNGMPHPIGEGIEAADAIHLVSRGSKEELVSDVLGPKRYPESTFIDDLDKVFVANNGVKVEDFQLADIPKKLITFIGEHFKDKEFSEKWITQILSICGEFDGLETIEQKAKLKELLAQLSQDPEFRKLITSNGWVDRFDSSKKMILYVGRLSPEKGYSRLEAAAQAARESDAQLAIFGFGDSDFEDYIMIKYPEVIFLNNMSDQRLLGNIIRGASDICLLTSTRETAGLVLLEGQLYGQSVVSTELPGPASLSNPDTLTIIPFCVDEKGRVDETATQEVLKIKLKEKITSLQSAEASELNAEFERNIAYARVFSTENMLDEMRHIYYEGIRFVQESIERTRKYHNSYIVNADMKDDVIKALTETALPYIMANYHIRYNLEELAEIFECILQKKISCLIVNIKETLEQLKPFMNLPINTQNQVKTYLNKVLGENRETFLARCIRKRFIIDAKEIESVNHFLEHTPVFELVIDMPHVIIKGNRHNILESLSVGGFSLDNLVIQAEDGSKFFLKVCKHQNKSEVELLRDLNMLQDAFWLQTQDGTVFATQQTYIPGLQLSVLLREPCLNIHDLHRKFVYVKNTLVVVKSFHDKGYIHNDLLPGNILCTREGRAHVVDFDSACKETEHNVAKDVQRLFLGAESEGPEGGQIFGLKDLLIENMKGLSLEHKIFELWEQTVAEISTKDNHIEIIALMDRFFEYTVSVTTERLLASAPLLHHFDVATTMPPVIPRAGMGAAAENFGLPLLYQQATTIEKPDAKTSSSEESRVEVLDPRSFVPCI